MAGVSPEVPETSGSYISADGRDGVGPVGGRHAVPALVVGRVRCLPSLQVLAVFLVGRPPQAGGVGRQWCVESEVLVERPGPAALAPAELPMSHADEFAEGLTVKRVVRAGEEVRPGSAGPSPQAASNAWTMLSRETASSHCVRTRGPRVA